MRTDMTEKILLRIALAALISVMLGQVQGVSCYAEDKNGEAENTGETVYKLTDDVQKWLDEGGSIPVDAKYATLSASDHLWVIDDKDFSDGKIELSVNENEKKILSGIALKDWLDHQLFFGEGYGKDRVKFIRPSKKPAF